jgi:hypothetical protein
LDVASYSYGAIRNVPLSGNRQAAIHHGVHDLSFRRWEV